MLRAEDIKRTVPFLPQSLLERSMGAKVVEAKSTRLDELPRAGLPLEYQAFNKSQRFLTMETLAIMNQGISGATHKSLSAMLSK